jgi:hypothetical protein
VIEIIRERRAAAIKCGSKPLFRENTLIRPPTTEWRKREGAELSMAKGKSKPAFNREGMDGDHMSELPSKVVMSGESQLPKCGAVADEIP